MRILALDPGLSGAAVVLEQIGGAIMLINAINLPTVGEESKRRLDSTTFAEWLRHHGPTHAYVEAAQPMAKQGVSSTFRYGRAAGAAEGVIAACKVPMTLVTPRMWKTHFRLDASKENAQALSAFQKGSRNGQG